MQDPGADAVVDPHHRSLASPERGDHSRTALSVASCLHRDGSGHNRAIRSIQGETILATTEFPFYPSLRTACGGVDGCRCGGGVDE